MILALLFVIASLALGYVLAVYAKFEGWLERLAAAIALGFSVTSFSIFLLSFALGSLSWHPIAEVSLVALAGALYLYSREKSKGKFFERKFLEEKTGPGLACALAIVAVLLFFSYLSFSQDAKGNIYSIENAWGDYPFHVMIANSFALRDNFPPIYPNLAGTPMRYPVLFDFLSSILIVGGAPLVASIQVPNALFIFSAVMLAYGFVRRVDSGKIAIAAALLLFFFNGNVGGIAFLLDLAAVPGKLAFISHVPEAYSRLDGGLGLMSLAFGVLIPQRTIIMGLALSFIVYSVLYKSLSKKKPGKDELAIAGIAMGMLPLVHSASFGAVAIVAAAAFAFKLREKLAIRKEWLWFAVPAIVLAVPQGLWITQQASIQGFMGVQIGWMADTTDLGKIAAFWLENAGLTLVLAVAGLFVAGEKYRKYYAGAAVVFLLGNLVRLQPWDWDNIKLFSHWLFFTSILAGIALQKGYEVVKKFAGKITASGAVSLLVLACTLSSLATFAYWSHTSAVLYSADDLKMGKFIEENTPTDALFAISPTHKSVVSNLAGRQVVMGYPGHLWSHGLKYSQIELDNREMLQGNRALLEKYGVGYVFLEENDARAVGREPGLYQVN